MKYFYVVILVIWGLFFSYKYGVVDVVKCTITDKNLDKNLSTGENEYMVFTDKGTFRIEDDVWYWNHKTADMYGSIRIDSTYIFTVQGFRISLFGYGHYKNIVKVEK